MSALKALHTGQRLQILCFRNQSIRKCSTFSQRHSQGTSLESNLQSKDNHNALETDEGIERFLMKWENVEGFSFLTDMRTRYIRGGISDFSEKQKGAIRKCEPRFSRLCPKVLTMDPIMRDLCLLTPEDLDKADSFDKNKPGTLKDIRDKFMERGILTYKQLKYAGSLIDRLKKQ